MIPAAFAYAGLAVLLSFLTMFLPVIRFSKVGIVDHKRNRAGELKKALWQRFFLDIVCLGVSLYSLYNFNSQQDVMAMMIRDTQSVDPLLFLSSSLFIVGLGLFCLRLFPHLVTLIFKVGQRLWSPAVYASFVKVIRSAGEEQFIMIFLLFTLAIGTFSAQAARTVNRNNDHQIRYLAGADLTFEEAWRTTGRNLGEDRLPTATGAPEQYFFIEPDFERFTHFEEVDALTRVQFENVNVRAIGDMDAMTDVQLMAIETDTFGQTIWFRDDLLRTHINHFLNVLASRPDGVLLSSNFRTVGGVEIGNTIAFTDRFGNLTRGTVMGFVDHWPGFSPVQRVDIDSQVVEIQNSLIIANLGFIQSEWSVRPYQVWMRTNTETNRFFYDFAVENRLRIPLFTDAKADVIASRSDPILQGTNGVLTVGFIVTLLICFTGFLIYWILSIRARVLQFGIFRAMGMSMRSLIGLLINEQLFITFTAIGLGALVGEISARLFVPLIQMSYSAADQAIPLLIVTEARDYVNLYTVVGTMIVICLVVLGGYISKIKIAQALKLGED
jgi:putative ABC transport system permease protein